MWKNKALEPSTCGLSLAHPWLAGGPPLDLSLHRACFPLPLSSGGIVRQDHGGKVCHVGYGVLTQALLSWVPVLYLGWFICKM